MSTLTEAAIFSKKASVWVVIGAAALIALFVFLGIGSMIKRAVFPTPPPPATVAFSKIPRFDYSEGFTVPPGETFILETVSGELPQLADKGKVFAIEIGYSSFGELDDLKKRAEQLKFTGSFVELPGGKVKFTDPRDPDRVLTVDKVTGNFTLTTNYASKAEIVTGRPSSLEDAIRSAQNFFADFGVWELEFPKEKIETKFQRIDGTKLTQTQSLNTANLIEVDFFRTNIDKMPVIWAVENKPLVSVLVSQEGIVAANLDITPVRKSLFASYPLKDVRSAFEELKSGGGAFNRPITASEIVISDVSLGYVESAKNNEYLEPVYLFRSPNGLIGYVPAVNELWVK